MNKTDIKPILKLLLLLAHADKSFHENEQEFLEKLIKDKNYPVKDYNQILDEVIKSKKTFKDQCLEVVHQITDREQRKTALKLLAELTAADYVLHEDEMLLLQIIADEWGMYKERLIA